MARKSQRLSASELDPEDGTDYADARKRRFELTPLFWGLVSVIGLGLLAAVVVLLGMLVGARAQDKEVLDSLKGIAAAITPGGRCSQSKEHGWGGWWDDATFRPKIPDVDSEQLAFFSAYMKENSVQLSPTVCSFKTENACNKINQWPYVHLIHGILGAPTFKGDCLNRFEPSMINSLSSKVIPREAILRLRPLCDNLPEESDNGNDNSGSKIVCPQNDCTSSAKLAYDRVLESLMEVLPYPCLWEKESLGSFLTARSPYGNTIATVEYNNN